jgi:hypothetical protein
MLFNPINWFEVKPNEVHKTSKGRLRVQCSEAVPLYIEAEGVEALAGVSTSFDVELSTAARWRVGPQKGVRVFVYVPERTSIVASGEVFTNIDRMVDESGTVAEVTRALRQLELMRRSALAEIKAEGRALKRKAKESSQPLVEPVADPVEPEAPPSDPVS